MPFHITQDEIFTVNRDERDVAFGESYDYIEDPDQLYINRMLDRASHSGNMQEVYLMHSRGQLRVRTYHRRVLKLMNTGNLPLSITAIKLEDGSGFVLENAKPPFTLSPGQTHLLNVGYLTDFSLAKIRRKLVFESAQGVIHDYILEA